MFRGGSPEHVNLVQTSVQFNTLVASVTGTPGHTKTQAKIRKILDATNRDVGLSLPGNSLIPVVLKNFIIYSIACK